ncbi:MAG: prolyl oligopeptidase family serine peptidase [Patescibacteria group bacterium]|jgi:alpha-beta hydrolase superfamily lysophospholipase
MKKYTLRTRFKDDIVCEFVVPNKVSNKVAIVCTGMPGYPRADEMLSWLARRGYWAFLPRYRGTWESGGKFLDKSPHQDVLDIIEELPKGFKNLWNGEIFKVKNPEVYLFGGSFGGPAVILNSKNSKIKKVVAISPVVDWRSESKAEPLNWIEEFTKEAFGNGYRFDKKDWQKLSSGKFYNPATAIKEIDPKKVLIFHAKDDKIVEFKPVKEFSEKINCQFVALNKGEHMSIRSVMKPEFWRKIKKFFDK